MSDKQKDCPHGPGKPSLRAGAPVPFRRGLIPWEKYGPITYLPIFDEQGWVFKDPDSLTITDKTGERGAYFISKEMLNLEENL